MYNGVEANFLYIWSYRIHGLCFEYHIKQQMIERDRERKKIKKKRLNLNLK